MQAREYKWDSEIFTYTAATNEIIIANSTNKTITSTIQGTSFISLSRVLAEGTAIGMIATEKLDGTILYMYVDEGFVRSA